MNFNEVDRTEGLDVDSQVKKTHKGNSVSVGISKGQDIFSKEINGQGAFSVKIGHLYQIKSEQFQKLT
jgi:hypothetical protein